VHTHGGPKPEECIKTSKNKTSENTFNGPDITFYNPQTDEYYRENVGKQTKTGQPYRREDEARKAIEAATGRKLEFTAYNI
jgi:hypothetical protein